MNNLNRLLDAQFGAYAAGQGVPIARLGAPELGGTEVLRADQMVVEFTGGAAVGGEASLDLSDL